LEKSYLEERSPPPGFNSVFSFLSFRLPAPELSPSDLPSNQLLPEMLGTESKSSMPIALLATLEDKM
jgi:hypothetical protein